MPGLRAPCAAATVLMLVVSTVGPSATSAAELIRGVTICATSPSIDCMAPPDPGGTGLPAATSTLASGLPPTAETTQPGTLAGAFPATTAGSGTGTSVAGITTTAGRATSRPTTSARPTATIRPTSTSRASVNGHTEGGNNATNHNGTENGGTENSGTENGGTEIGGTENGGTENGGTENGGTENGGGNDGTGNGGGNDGTGNGDNGNGGNGGSDGNSGGDPGGNTCAGNTTPPVNVAGNGTVTAAQKLNWGTPTHVENFTTGLGDWGVYNSPGHGGNGLRRPSAAQVAGGVLTITGDAGGTSAGMAWNCRSKFGRWEVRMMAPAPSDDDYHAVALLWPDAEDWPVGGEVDFAEMSDSSRQQTDGFLHYSASNQQESASVRIPANQWHNWAVEWTPTGITYYVDGNPWFHTSDTTHLPPRSMHLTLQLDLFRQGGGLTRSQMIVDWAAFYPLSGTGAAIAPLTAPSVAATPTATTQANPTPTTTAQPTPTRTPSKGTPTPTPSKATPTPTQAKSSQSTSQTTSTPSKAPTPTPIPTSPDPTPPPVSTAAPRSVVRAATDPATPTSDG